MIRFVTVVLLLAWSLNCAIAVSAETFEDNYNVRKHQIISISFKNIDYILIIFALDLKGESYLQFRIGS
jgi:hypothetical protein